MVLISSGLYDGALLYFFYLDLLDHVQKLSETAPDDGGGGTEKSDEGLRHRRGSHSRESPDSKQTSEPKEKDYTEEQLTAVKRYVLC